MGAADVPLKNDVNGKPAPQFYNTETGQNDYWTGDNNGPKVQDAALKAMLEAGTAKITLTGVQYTNVGPQTIAGGATYTTGRIDTAGAGSMVLNYLHGRGDTDTKATLRWWRNEGDSYYAYEQDDVLAEESIYGGAAVLPVIAGYVEIILTNLGVAEDAFYLQYGFSPLPVADTNNIGSRTDAAAAAGGPGSATAHLRRLTTDLNGAATKLQSIVDKLTDGTQKVQVSGANVTLPVDQVGNTLEEQKTQADAVGGVLTFSENIEHIEIFNTDAANAGVFEVNGISINMPADSSFKSKIGGTPAATVTVTGATTSYIVGRYA